jgi:antitoxin MazE
MGNSTPLGGRVIAAFGGVVKMSDATGWPVSTIESWKSKNTIPQWRLRDIRNAAQASRVMLPDDFPDGSVDRAYYEKTKKRYIASRPRQARVELRENESGNAAATAFDRPVVSYVKKTGEHYALVMSASILEQAGLSEGARVEIKATDDGRIMVSRSKRHFTLDELLAGMTPDREHPLEDDAPRGEETL